MNDEVGKFSNMLETTKGMAIFDRFFFVRLSFFYNKY